MQFKIFMYDHCHRNVMVCKFTERWVEKEERAGKSWSTRYTKKA